jgi:haloacetate dehalogenase
MFEGFTRTEVDTASSPFGGARIHLRHGGDGPPLLLLHGNPLTHVSWHKIADRLAERFHVVAADLRGYGDSVGPEDAGDNNINYSFRAMAQDQVEVMEKLGYREFFAAGHDRGARTVARMCLDHPDRVKRAAVVDILPNHHIWTHASREWAVRSWHWALMAQPYDLPERLLAGVRAQWFMEKKLSKPGIGLGFFDPAAFAEYVRCFNWKTIKGSCADYRACATCDFEMDKLDFEAGNKITVPLLVLWGARSHTEGVHGDVLAVWRRNYATNARGGGAIPCGHYVPEEAPDETLRYFLEHFAE